MSINDIIRSAVNNVQKSEFNVDEWAKEKNRQREWAYKTQDEMAEKITVDSEKYKNYLNVQSQFPNYSVGNALLVTVQKPDAKQLREADSWKRDKVYFKKNPQRIIILEPTNTYIREDGTEAQSFDSKIVYDISDMQMKRQLNTVPYTQESILKGILSMSPVQVEVVEHTSNPNKQVNYNANKRTIEVSSESEVKDTIRGLVTEIASIQMLSVENTELDNFRNKSVAYMISKKYGMALNEYDFSKIPQELQQMSPKEVKSELGKIAECYAILADGIDRTLEIQPKVKNHREYER